MAKNIEDLVEKIDRAKLEKNNIRRIDIQYIHIDHVWVYKVIKNDGIYLGLESKKPIIADIMEKLNYKGINSVLQIRENDRIDILWLDYGDNIQN